MSESPLEMAVLAYLLVLVRVSLFIAMMPFFREENIPRLIKFGLAIALSFAWYSSNATAESAQAAVGALHGHWLAYSIAIIREAILGAALGYAFGLLLLPARIAGNYIGQEMGLTMASMASPGASGNSNVMGGMFETLAALLFFVGDIHHVMFAMLHASFRKWQIGSPLPIGTEAWVSMQVAQTQTWGMQLVAPVGLCMLLNLILLVVIMKAAPALNLFTIGFTLRIMVGLAATFAFLPEMLSIMSGILESAGSFIAF